MSLRHTLLGILDWTPLHGYALREIAKGYAWLHPMSNTNIYPALRQLEEEGFVSHRQEVVDGGVRKVYATTRAGKDELLRWLSDRTPQTGVYRDPTLLKISMLRDRSVDGARAWLGDEVERCRKTLTEIETVLEGSETWPRFTAYVVEHGRDLVRLRLEFFEKLVGEAEQAEDATGSAPSTPAAAR